MLLIKHGEILGGLAASLDIDGPLNNSTAEGFIEYIEGLLDRGIVFLIINASAIKTISSDGISIIIRAQRIVSEKNGFLVMYSIPPEIASMYRLLGFDKLIRIARGRIEAMEIIDKQIEMRGIDRSLSVTRPDSEERVDFEAIVIECGKCRSLIRVKGPGEFKCPECEALFTVSNDRSVHF